MTEDADIDKVMPIIMQDKVESWDIVKRRIEDHIEMRRREVRIEGDFVSAERAIDNLSDEDAFDEITKLHQYCTDILAKRRNA